MDETATLDQLDRAVLEHFRRVARDGDVAMHQEDEVITRARQRAYEETAARTGRPVPALIVDTEFDPLPLNLLYLRAVERQRQIMERRMDDYLESRALQRCDGQNVTLPASEAQTQTWRTT
jgi:hypothetical protein